MPPPKKTPAPQSAVNAFPGRTRALACFRPRLAVGTDARPRASVSRATDIVVPPKLPKYHFSPFYALKPHPTITQPIVANPRAVGRVTPCAPLLTSQRTSFLQPPPSQCFTLKKQIMQVPVFTTCYVRIQSAQDAGRIATGFPLPSMGRGIEGEGWSYPEPPPVRFFLHQPHPGPG